MTVFVIAGTPRTGSNLLTHALISVGLPPVEEIFSRASLAAADVTESSDSVMRAYLMGQLKADGDPLRGFKVFWHQVRSSDVRALIAELLSGSLVHPRPTVIHLYRRDIALQAVSIIRAYVSGYFTKNVDGTDRRLLYPDAYWASPGGVTAARIRQENGKAFDVGQLLEIVHSIENDNKSWQSLFDAVSARTYSICYEDLAADLPGQLNALLRHLGYPYRLAADYQSPLIVQRDELSHQLANHVRSSLTQLSE